MKTAGAHSATRKFSAQQLAPSRPGSTGRLLSSGTCLGSGVVSVRLRVALVAVLTVLASGLSASAASAASIPSSVTTRASMGFSDVLPSDPTYKNVMWLAESGITVGYPDGTFRPTNAVTRGAMSAFLYRFHDSPSYTPLLRPVFPDVPTNDEFYRTISWLSSSGITAGYSDGTYKKNNPVTRGAMAAFLYRAAGSPHYTAPPMSPFTDLKPTDTFYKSVSWLASTGITVGFPDAQFKPERPVTRSAMASFLRRYDSAFERPVYTSPGNPGDSKNCSDFSSWREAQSWYEIYFPYYGDIARLDGDGDGIACQSLPGAP